VRLVVAIPVACSSGRKKEIIPLNQNYMAIAEEQVETLHVRRVQLS
jgi:hypothetical protein